MKEIIEKIQEIYVAFQKDAELQVENGNKAAGTRPQIILGTRKTDERIS